MKIAATERPSLFRPIQHTIYLPQESAALVPAHTGELMKAISVVAGKNLGAAGIATGAWKLTTIPQATTPQELTNILISNNISSEKAPRFAGEIQQLLSLPWIRTILIGVSGGALVYLVVEKTKWSRKKKWLATLGGCVFFAALYLVLRHYGIMR